MRFKIGFPDQDEYVGDGDEARICGVDGPRRSSHLWSVKGTLVSMVRVLSYSTTKDAKE